MVAVFETIMLICFGLSWPNNIIKSLKTKSVKGRSVLFLIFIDIGYICGIISKLLSPNIIYFVLAIYILNFSMVTTDLCLYIYYRNKEKKLEQN